jgi:hypothetical protein
MQNITWYKRRLGITTSITARAAAENDRAEDYEEFCLDLQKRAAEQIVVYSEQIRDSSQYRRYPIKPHRSHSDEMKGPPR